MITKIDYIKNFGIYRNFIWDSTDNELVEFKKKNLFYGWNYSGKTTLSRIFSSLRDGEVYTDFSNGDFKISTENHGSYNNTNVKSFPFAIEVFNSDYIKENLSWEIDEDINAIFFQVGDSAKIAIKIKDLQDKIIDINGNDTKKGLREPYQKKIDDFEIFEKTLFTDESRRIKNDIFSSIVDFTKRDFKKQIPYVKQDLNSFILSDSKIKQLSKAVKVEEPREQLEDIVIKLNLTELTKKANAILQSTPEKKDLIDILEKNPENYKWVKEGLDYHSENDSCLFCNNKITSARLEELNKFYENQGAKVRDEIKDILQSIESEINSIEEINLPKSIQDFNEGFQESYKKTKEKLDKEIARYINKLQILKTRLSEKQLHKLYRKLSKVAILKLDSIEQNIVVLNKIIAQNNSFTENFENEIKTQRLVYINHLVAKFLRDNKYLLKEKGYNSANKKIGELEIKIKNYQKEIDRLIALNNSVEEGGQQLNYFVQSFLGQDDIEIKYDNSKKKYSLFRGNEIAKNLSEGEKMAISFSHFLVNLKSVKSKNKLKDTIVFIDDPMSSLDGNHIFQINALLKDFLYKKTENPNDSSQIQWVQNCLQLFVSTHNYEFFNLLKEMPTIRGFNYKKKESRYFIARKLNNSILSILPKVYDSFKSEYHFLFQQIHDFNSDPNNTTSDKLLIMPNILRRFLEIYTLAKYPVKQEVDDRATKLFGGSASKRICKPFHYFSHFNNIDRIGKQSEFLSDVTKACSELIKQLKKDKLHYEALLNSI